MKQLSELKQQAEKAYYWQSMDAEGRASRFLSYYEEALKEDLAKLYLEQVPEEEIVKYNDTFISKVADILTSESRCANPMVTGSSKFDCTRNRKKIEVAIKKRDDFYAWSEKAMKAILKRYSKEEENKSVNETIEYVTNLAYRNAWYSSSYIKNYLERKAANGDVEAVKAGIAVLVEFQNNGKPVFTKRSGVWKLTELAEKKAESKRQISGMQNMVIEHECCNIIVDFAEERLKLVFDGKPAYSKIQELKHNAFKWSPSNKAWQRKLTSAAAHAVESMGYDDNLLEEIRTYIKNNKSNDTTGNKESID